MYKESVRPKKGHKAASKEILDQKVWLANYSNRQTAPNLRFKCLDFDIHSTTKFTIILWE